MYRKNEGCRPTGVQRRRQKASYNQFTEPTIGRGIQASNDRQLRKCRQRENQCQWWQWQVDRASYDGIIFAMQKRHPDGCLKKPFKNATEGIVRGQGLFGALDGRSE